MQILFVHPNFPAQFGPSLSKLAGRKDVDCVFVTKANASTADGVRCIRIAVTGGATRATHYCSRTFENAVWHAHGVYEACKSTPDLKPDLIVGHSGFGTTVFLRELYDSPIINFFEYYYHAHGSDLDFRPDFPPARHQLSPLAYAQCDDSIGLGDLCGGLYAYAVAMELAAEGLAAEG